MFGKQALYLIIGGMLKDLESGEFEDLAAIELVGIYENFEHAENIWRQKSQASVDIAAKCYRMVALHHIMSPAQRITDFLQNQNVSAGLCVAAETSVQETCQKMIQERVGVAFIVAHEREPVGVFSERDLVHVVASKDKDWQTKSIRDYMNHEVITIREDMRLIEALALMQEQHIRHLPVISDHNQLRSVISIRDFAFAHKGIIKNDGR